MRRWSNLLAVFILVLAARLRLAVIDAVSCKETSYNLSKQRYIYFASPNYPKKFETQTQCNWLLVAPRGYRVKLVFIKFYLVNAQRLCIHQKVQIDDLLSGRTDGPYCGNTLPPVLRSAGQMLRIKLQSDARNVNQQYVGFQAKVIATKEPSSIRIRDDMGKWRTYGAGTSGASILKPPGADIELDENDNSNEATELRNKMRNFQNNMKTLTEGNAEFKPLGGASNNGRIKPLKPKKPTKRKRPSTRAVSVPPTTRRHMEQHEHGHAENELHHGLIIAIACGIMFLLALTFAAYNYCKKRGCIGKPDSVTTLAAATRNSTARKDNSNNLHKHRQQQHYAEDYRQLSSPSSSRQHALPGGHVMMATSSASLSSSSSPATTTTKVMPAPTTPPRPNRDHKRHHHHHHHKREQRNRGGHEAAQQHQEHRRHHSNHARRHAAASPGGDRQGAGRSSSNRR